LGKGGIFLVELIGGTGFTRTSWTQADFSAIGGEKRPVVGVLFRTKRGEGAADAPEEGKTQGGTFGGPELGEPFIERSNSRKGRKVRSGKRSCVPKKKKKRKRKLRLLQKKREKGRAS